MEPIVHTHGRGASGLDAKRRASAHAAASTAAVVFGADSELFPTPHGRAILRAEAPAASASSGSLQIGQIEQVGLTDTYIEAASLFERLPNQ